MKYVCIGGWVISKTDGDKHYINGRKLMRLYGLNDTIADCIEEKDEDMYFLGRMPYDHPNDMPIKLRPRYDGRYDLLDNH